MSQRGPKAPPDRLDEEVAVRVLRLEPGQRLILRTLASRYSGCLTHYKGGRGQYCPGAELCQLHTINPTWKGYTPVEVWSQVDSLWFPWVLEITENLDLDLKPRFDRGQVWELDRLAPRKKSGSSPVRGKLIEKRDPAHFPEPFPMSGVLRTLYHVDGIRLDVDNHLPPRTLVRPSKAQQAPTPVRAEEPPTSIPREKLDQLRQRLKGQSPAEANGVKD